MPRIVDSDVQSTTRAESTLTVDIAETCKIRYGTVFALSMELDEEYNNGKTCFAPGERAYFKIYASGPYRRGATLGNSYRDAANIGETVTEYISFTSFSGSASKPVWNITNYEWVGKSLGPIKILKGSNRIITDEDEDKDGYGVILVTYDTRFNRFYHICNQEADVIVYAIERGGWWPGTISDETLHPFGQDYAETEETSESGTRVVDKTDEIEETQPVLQEASLTLQYRNDCNIGENAVTIIVEDAMTGQVLSGASVSIDGGFRTGVTDVAGEWYAGTLTTGTHSIRVTRDGYQPTTGDMLANDEFEVSS
jgi:hypothetical protein